MNFEEMLLKLQDIVAKMEDKSTTLDESLELFNQGVKLSSECMDKLNDSKGKVELLVKSLDGVTKETLEVE